MSDNLNPRDGDESALDPRLRDAIAHLPDERPDPDFKSRMKAQFLAASAVPVPVRPSSAHRLWRVAAAALLLGGATTGYVANRPQPWQVAALEVGGRVQVDGVDVAGSEGELARRLVDGVTLRSPHDAELTLQLPGELALVLARDTEIELIERPARWWGRRGTIRMIAGEVRITSGPRFGGATLEVTSREATVRVVGTTLAVRREQETTCVCVLEGEVEIVSAAGSSARVRPGWRRFESSVEAQRREEAILPMERMKLEMLRDQSREWWGR